MQVLILLVLIIGGVLGFLILPVLLGANAKRRRRKQVAFDERHQSVDLFKSKRGAPADGPAESEPPKSSAGDPS